MNNKGFYFVKPNFGASNILYKSYFVDDKIYLAKIAGQFYDRNSTLQQLHIWRLPFVKLIEKKPEPAELYYDNTSFDDTSFHKKDKSNIILTKHDVDRIAIKETDRNHIFTEK